MKTVNIDIPDGVDVELDGSTLVFDGSEGTVEREVSYPDISVSVDDGEVVLRCESDRRQLLAALGTFESQVENAIHGVDEGFEYRMKVLYSHFPMQVEVKGDEVEVRNFLGEKHPRKTEIRGETEVEVSEEEIVLRGPNKEDVGQTAASIEQLTYINDKDVRVFQDGIYITQKPEA
ncbi:MAG: 50S ribosomal protein L6 [Halobacteria archaeon]|nr:50S ribosomal protein L6 [Halobacteria archaeon]